MPVGDLQAGDDDVVLGMQADGQLGRLAAWLTFLADGPASARRDAPSQAICGCVRATRRCADTRVQSHAEFFGPVQVAAHRDVGDRSAALPTANAFCARCLSRMPSAPSMRPRRNSVTGVSPVFANCTRKRRVASSSSACGCPTSSQRRTSRDFRHRTLRTCRTARRGNCRITPDWRERCDAVLEHRHFAHLVDASPDTRACGSRR